MYFRVLLKRICNFILILPVAMFVSGFQPAMQNAIENPTPLGRFDLMTPTSGWVILGHQLFWTEDAGETWMDLSPSIPAEASIEDIYFMDNNTGWMLWSMMNPGGLFVFQIAHTQDHGVTWTVEDLPLLSRLQGLRRPVPDQGRRASPGRSDSRSRKGGNGLVQPTDWLDLSEAKHWIQFQHRRALYNTGWRSQLGPILAANRG